MQHKQPPSEPVYLSDLRTKDKLLASIHKISTLLTRPISLDTILTSILEKSGYIDELKNSEDPQDATRLENLIEFVSVAGEFVAAAHTEDVGPGTSGLLPVESPEPPEEDADGGGLAAVHDGSDQIGVCLRRDPTQRLLGRGGG